jgi:uncharacterized protein YdeI (YjbR/CyaY-like superfamily)
MEDVYNGVATTSAADPAAWRRWLEGHHDQAKSVWLIIFRKGSGTPSITYDQAVDEALCFGWIDSKPNKRDDKSYYQFMSRRNPKSNWSQVNRDKVARLEAEGRMTEAGRAMIRLAQEKGTWQALDVVYADVHPPDFQAALEAVPQALQYWNAFPKSAKNGILEWITSAKRPETRQKRIAETVELAAQNIRANQYRPK